MEEVININGVLQEAATAGIPVLDRGFLFGDSIYETLRTYRKKPFLIDRHLLRLENSARLLYMELPESLERLKKEVLRTIEATSNSECYIRIVVSRGAGKRIGLDIDLSAGCTFVIIVVPLETPSDEMYSHGVKVSVVSVRRNDITTLNPRIKSSNLLNNVLAFVEAGRKSAYEGILCNLAGNIAEGTGSNIFMARLGRIVTPPVDAGLLEGVTRALTLDLALSEGIPAEERNFTPRELLDSDECFITSTTKEILPVRKIDDRELAVAPGPFTSRLMKAYRNFVDDQR